MPLNTDHVEDALYHRHRLCVNDAIVSGIVVPKVVRRTGSCHELTLPGLLELAPPTTLTYLRSLVLAELVEDAVRKLTLRRVVSAVVHGTDLRPVFLELPAEEVVVGRLTGEAVPVLCQHHGDVARSHQVPHTVHAGPLKACSTLSRVYYLLEDLVAFSGGVLLQGFYLLGQ